MEQCSILILLQTSHHVEQPDDDLWFFRLNTEDLENEMHVALDSQNKSTWFYRSHKTKYLKK